MRGLSIGGTHRCRGTTEKPGMLRSVLILIEEMDKDPRINVQSKQQESESRNNEEHYWSKEKA
jgi:hypothetical protein